MKPTIRNKIRLFLHTIICWKDVNWYWLKEEIFCGCGYGEMNLGKYIKENVKQVINERKIWEIMVRKKNYQEQKNQY